MLENIRSFFENNILLEKKGTDDRSLQLAAAALLIEVARADFEFDDSERRVIIDAVQGLFGLSDIETQEIVSLAEKEVEQATCLFEFTRMVNKYFTHEQKIKVVALMWQVSFSDADKDKYEEHLIRRIAELLYVSHADFIRLREKSV